MGLPRVRAEGRPRPLFELQGLRRARHGRLSAFVLHGARRPPAGFGARRQRDRGRRLGPGPADTRHHARCHRGRAQGVWDSPELADGWTFGPADDDARPVRWIIDRLGELWPDRLDWRCDEGPHPHEARYLRLDSSRARVRLGWAPGWGLDEALAAIVAWDAALPDRARMPAVTRR